LPRFLVASELRGGAQMRSYGPATLSFSFALLTNVGIVVCARVRQ
jgi:hypothetical protein